MDGLKPIPTSPRQLSRLNARAEALAYRPPWFMLVLVRSGAGFEAGADFGSGGATEDVEWRCGSGDGGRGQARRTKNASSSPVPTTASTSGMLFMISSR